MSNLDVAANDCQGRTGAILDFAALVDRFRDLVDDGGLVEQAGTKATQARQGGRYPAQGSFRLLGHALRCGDREELLGVEAAAQARFFQRRSHVHGAVEVERGPEQP